MIAASVKPVQLVHKLGLMSGQSRYVTAHRHFYQLVAIANTLAGSIGSSLVIIGRVFLPMPLCLKLQLSLIIAVGIYTIHKKLNRDFGFLGTAISF